MKKINTTSLLALGLVTLNVFWGLHSKVPSYRVRTNSLTNNLHYQEDNRSIKAAVDQVYFRYRMNPRTGQIDQEDVLKAVAQADRMKALSKGGFPLEWEEMGPDNVGGRTRALLADNRNPDIIYAGGVGGGLWRSDNQAYSWTRINDMAENLAVSCIAQTPDGTIYYGTGEQSFTRGSNGIGNSGVTGGGIWKSLDGINFTRLTATIPNGHSSPWANINTMAALKDQNIVLVGLNGANAIRYSNDGGATWTTVTGIARQNCHEIKIGPDGTIWAVIGNKIFRNTSGNPAGPYTEINAQGLPGPNNVSRIAIGIAPQDGNYIYAGMANANNNKLEGIYRSTDKGDTWTQIGQGGSLFFDPYSNGLQGQGDYDNVVAVDPENKDRVWVAGVDWWEWTPNKGWLKTANSFESPYNKVYMHVDKHAIITDTRTTPYTIYVGSDGGVTKSYDKGKTWVTSNKSYNVTQFYAIAANYGGVIIGGTQDNGTQMIKGNSFQKKMGIEVMGGDGFQAELSRKLPNFVIAESYYGRTSRSFDGGETFTNIFSCRMKRYLYGWNTIIKCEDQPPGGKYSDIFNTPIDLLEDEFTDSTRFAIALNNMLWFTFDIRDTRKAEPIWYKLAANIGNNPFVENLTTVAISPDGKHVFAGTSIGRIVRVNIENVNWDTTLTLPEWWDDPSAKGVVRKDFYVPGVNPLQAQTYRAITSINTDPNNPNRIIVTLGNYGSQEFIYESTNILDSVGAISFNSLQGNLPKMPVYDAVYHIDQPNTIIIATELGIWASANNGVSWTEQNNGMARVAVYMLRQYEFKPWEGPVLYAATHGRGIYKSRSFSTGIKPKQVSTTNSLLAFPNPALTNISFSGQLEQQRTTAVFSIYDIQGALKYQNSLQTDINGGFLIKPDLNQLPEGLYLAVIETAQGRQVTRFSLLR